MVLKQYINNVFQAQYNQPSFSVPLVGLIFLVLVSFEMFCISGNPVVTLCLPVLSHINQPSSPVSLFCIINPSCSSALLISMVCFRCLDRLLENWNPFKEFFQRRERWLEDGQVDRKLCCQQSGNDLPVSEVADQPAVHYVLGIHSQSVWDFLAYLSGWIANDSSAQERNPASAQGHLVQVC